MLIKSFFFSRSRSHANYMKPHFMTTSFQNSKHLGYLLNPIHIPVVKFIFSKRAI